jgi:hypothetical protein
MFTCLRSPPRVTLSAMADRQPFRATVRYFRPEKLSGLTVADVPAEVTASLGGLKQLRVRVLVNGKEFTSNTMPAGGGVLALSLSKQILRACGLSVGDEAEFEVERLVT